MSVIILMAAHVIIVYGLKCYTMPWNVSVDLLVNCFFLYDTLRFNTAFSFFCLATIALTQPIERGRIAAQKTIHF